MGLISISPFVYIFIAPFTIANTETTYYKVHMILNYSLIRYPEFLSFQFTVKYL